MGDQKRENTSPNTHNETNQICQRAENPCAISIFRKRIRLIVSIPAVSKLSTLFGPSDRIRTCGILLPKQARYQLRYTRLFRFSSGWAYSPKPSALPTALVPDRTTQILSQFFKNCNAFFPIDVCLAWVDARFGQTVTQPCIFSGITQRCEYIFVQHFCGGAIKLSAGRLQSTEFCWNVDRSNNLLLKPYQKYNMLP